MNVHCKLYGPPREVMGRKQVTITVEKGATIEDVLVDLANQASELESVLFSDDGSLSGGIGVLLNEVNVSRRDGLATSVESGDVLLITPPIHGG